MIHMAVDLCLKLWNIVAGVLQLCVDICSVVVSETLSQDHCVTGPSVVSNTFQYSCVSTVDILHWLSTWS